MAGVSMSMAPKSMMPVTSSPVNRTWSCQMSRRQGCSGNDTSASGSSCAMARGIAVGQFGEELAGERGEFGPDCVGDCAGEFVDAAA